MSLRSSNYFRGLTGHSGYSGFSGISSSVSYITTTLDLNGLSGDYTPNISIMNNTLVIKLTGTLSGNINLILPDTVHTYIIYNYTLKYKVTAKTLSGTGIDLYPNNIFILQCDETNINFIHNLNQNINPNKIRLTGLGDLNNINIGTNINPNSAQVYVQGIHLDKDLEYEVIESTTNSGNFDTLHPLVNNIFPLNDNIILYHYE